MSSAQYAQPMAQPAVFRTTAAAPMSVSAAPPGTFAPGTKVQVGSHRVTIDKYLSEGGFAHVYLVRVPPSSSSPATPETAVLKRVAVPDKEALANMRTEVETMKKLKGHRHIVTYMDSHASQLKGGGYEVFLLMEYCSGGGLIDFMNTRLQHRLTEPEILHIFSDVAEGVATMHYLKPPLLHRDLKVENVLITSSGSNKVFKLCDFGSTAPPRPAATTAAEGRLIEDDVQRHTTLQYRSPEMIDVYRKQPIDEKSDIWALGVLLYKLCYYTTPFEEVGQMAILNASFKYPSYPQFSDRIKKLIGWMLREDPRQRPNIYQVVAEICSMRHRNVPIKDIYTNRTRSEARRNQQLPNPDPQISSPPIIGLQKVAPVQQVQQIPDITPMRRGRPTAPVQQPPTAKPSASPMRGTASDPFAALDSNDVQIRRAAADELAARFPSLDEFSLLHDQGQKFEFGQTSATPDPTLSKRVTEALADDAFALPTSSKPELRSKAKPTSAVPSTTLSRSTSVKKPSHYEGTDSPRTSDSLLKQPIPPKSGMVSTGVQTSPRSSPAPPQPKFSDVNSRPIWRVPPPTQQQHHTRALSQTRSSPNPQASPLLKPETPLPPRPSLDSRSKSQLSGISITRSPASSRPSLESSRPSALDLGTTLDRSKSANASARPVSIHVESNLDYLRDRELAPGRSFDAPSLQNRLPPSMTTNNAAVSDNDDEDDHNIRSDVAFLRTIERDDPHAQKHRHRRSTSSSAGKHAKRASLSSITTGTKNIVKGRFGDAFRRFETNAPSSSSPSAVALKAPEYERDRTVGLGLEDSESALLDPRGGNRSLTPIAASEATSGRSDDGHLPDFVDSDIDTLSPEARREIERRRLSDEERRVAKGAAEYKAKVAAQPPRHMTGGGGAQAVGEGGSRGKVGVSKASTIQSRVRNLLDESSRPTGVTRTAEGYGKYTDTAKPLPAVPTSFQGPGLSAGAAGIGQKPLAPAHQLDAMSAAHARPRTNMSAPVAPLPSASAPPALSLNPKVTGPMMTGRGPPPLPLKPKKLQTGTSSPTRTSSTSLASTSANNIAPTALAGSSGAVGGGAGTGEDFDVEAFSKRYPSLSGLEMVERDIPSPGALGSGSGLRGRVRDV